jgi:hypothetical protein
MSALESLQPEESLRHLLSSDLLESVLGECICDGPDPYLLFSLFSKSHPAGDSDDTSEAVPSESRIHKYVQQPKQVPVQLMQGLTLDGFCAELRQSLTELNTPTLLIADRLKPGVLLKSLKGEIQILMNKPTVKRAKPRRHSNKENKGQESLSKK